MRRFLTFLLITLLGNAVQLRAGERPDLEKAYRAWYQGLSSKDKAEREKTLRSMLLEKKDVEFLFPKEAGRLWPLWEKAHDNLIRNFDTIAMEATRHGAVEKVEPIDVRKDKKKSVIYKQVLDLIPKDVPVFELAVTFKNGSGGSGAYVLVNDQWRLVRDFDGIPKVLEKLK